MNDVQAKLSEREVLDVMECPKWVDDLRCCVEAEHGFIASREPAGARNVIDMGVRIDDVTKIKIPLGKNGFVLIGDKCGIDDSGFTGLATSDQV